MLTTQLRNVTFLILLKLAVSATLISFLCLCPKIITILNFVIIILLSLISPCAYISPNHLLLNFWLLLNLCNSIILNFSVIFYFARQYICGIYYS